MDQEVSAGEQIKKWRQRRRLSQLDLALDAGISTRHLSFLETGKARPSRPMLIRLAEKLRVPAREQNLLLVSAGFAPARPQRPLNHPAMTAVRAAVDLLLKAYEPFPALAIDRHWTLVSANQGIQLLISGVESHLLEPPVNVLRLSLHPEGVAPRIRHLAGWRAHVFRRLEEQIDVSADPVLAALLDELRTYPGGISKTDPFDGVAVPLVIETELGDLSFLSTTTVFGTPVDVLLDELAIEAFLPADARTRELIGAR